HVADRAQQLFLLRRSLLLRWLRLSRGRLVLLRGPWSRCLRTSLRRHRALTRRCARRKARICSTTCGPTASVFHFSMISAFGSSLPTSTDTPRGCARSLPYISSSGV